MTFWAFFRNAIAKKYCTKNLKKHVFLNNLRQIQSHLRFKFILLDPCMHYSLLLLYLVDPHMQLALSSSGGAFSLSPATVSVHTTLFWPLGVRMDIPQYLIEWCRNLGVFLCFPVSQTEKLRGCINNLIGYVNYTFLDSRQRGMTPDVDNMQAVLTYPRPSRNVTLSLFRSGKGLCSYNERCLLTKGNWYSFVTTEHAKQTHLRFKRNILFQQCWFLVLIDWACWCAYVT